jgi:lysophospholipase L1-like esterase
MNWIKNNKDKNIISQIKLEQAFFVLSVIIMIFGVITSFSVGIKWMIIVLILYSIPVLSQLIPSKVFRACGLWFGFFMILQTVISPTILNNSLKTLKPSMKRTFDVQGGVPGISGVQQITTDSKGFRVTKTIAYDEKKDDNYRIFAIGSSTTEQLLIDDKKTWTHLLQENLSNYFHQTSVEVINTGVSGTRITHHLMTLKEISQYKPDMVIFLIGGNDWIYHIMSHFNPFIDMAFDRTMFGRSIRRIAEKTTGREKASELEVVKGEDFQSYRNTLSKSKKTQFRPASVSSYYVRLLGDIVSFCEDRHITYVFLTQPNGYHNSADKEYREKLSMIPRGSFYALDFTDMVYIARLYNNYLIRHTTKGGIRLLDLAEKIPGSYDYLYDDYHFNIAGAMKVSQLLFDFLRPIIEDKLNNRS